MQPENQRFKTGCTAVADGFATLLPAFENIEKEKAMEMNSSEIPSQEPVTREGAVTTGNRTFFCTLAGKVLRIFITVFSFIALIYLVSQAVFPG